jgi:hypothetical protein
MAKTQSPTHNTLLCLRPRLISVRYCDPFQLKTVFRNQLIPHKKICFCLQPNQYFFYNFFGCSTTRKYKLKCWSHFFDFHKSVSFFCCTISSWTNDRNLTVKRNLKQHFSNTQTFLYNEKKGSAVLNSLTLMNHMAKSTTQLNFTRITRMSKHHHSKVCW